MQFRSFGRRKIAAFASAALVAGALVAPAVLAAPAEATTTPGVGFTCTFGGNSFPYTTDIDLTAEWDKATGRATLSARLGTAMPNGAPPYATQSGQTQTAELVTKVDGSGTSTTLTGTTTADFKGGEAITVPTMSAKVGAKGQSLSVVVESFKLTLGSFGAITCVLPTAFTASVVPITFPTGSSLNYLCTFGANKFAYLTNAVVTADRTGANTAVGVQLESMPNTAPVFVTIPNATHAATLVMSGNGSASMNATGSSVANFAGGTPVAMPKMTVQVPGNPATMAVTAGDITVVVGGSTTIPCTLAAPVTLPTVNVTVPPAPGPTAACTAATTGATNAQAALTAAQAKDTKAKAAVKKAKASLKKLIKAKAPAKKIKAAKAKLKKAKSAATKAAKALKAAQTALAAAIAAQKANC